MISRSLRAFRMTIADDVRTFDVRKGLNEIPEDFLHKWASANWDAEVINLLQWPGKPATRRVGGHESGSRDL